MVNIWIKNDRYVLEVEDLYRNWWFIIENGDFQIEIGLFFIKNDILHRLKPEMVIFKMTNFERWSYEYIFYFRFKIIKFKIK